MRKFILVQERFYELAPLTFEEFNMLIPHSGPPLVSYREWLNHNNLHELSEFYGEKIKFYIVYPTSDEANTKLEFKSAEGWGVPGEELNLLDTQLGNSEFFNLVHGNNTKDELHVQ